MSQEARDFVLRYFTSKGLPDFNDEAELLECEYLDKGIIDSLGIVELVVAIESRFDIELSSEDMQSGDFGTIGGLINIVERLLGKKSG